jgi:hypothetical protein
MVGHAHILEQEFIEQFRIPTVVAAAPAVAATTTTTTTTTSE